MTTRAELVEGVITLFKKNV